MTADDWAAMERRMAEVTAERNRWIVEVERLERALGYASENRDAARAELAQRDQAIARVRNLANSLHGNGASYIAGAIQRALDGGAS